MLNNKDNKIKKLKTLYWIVGSLSGLLTILLFSFLIMIVVSNNSSKPTAQEPIGTEEPVNINANTIVIVNEYCLHCDEVYSDEQLARNIKNLTIPTLQGLKSYLVNIEKPADVIKEFTSERVVVEYTIERCDRCLDDSLYMVITGGLLHFHEGFPWENNLLGSLADQVLIIDTDRADELTKGIKLEDYNLHLGLYNNSSLAVYNNQPTGIRPLFMFTNLSVKTDSIDFLNDEEPFTSMEELLDLLEAYAR